MTHSDFDSIQPKPGKPCHAESGWRFQYADHDVSKPSNNIDDAGSDWTTFGPTNSSGVAVAIISNPDHNGIWVRERFDTDYVPFSGDTTPPRDDVSAEIYCHKDVLNYDNYDIIYEPSHGSSYYCVAFNALKPSVCGNSVLEGGEQCERSGGVFDTCCDSSTCQFKSASVSCRASAGDCDVAEICTGSSAACPADAKSTAVCRAAAGACDVAESCDGVGNSCPADSFQQAGTSCSDSLWCNGLETCNGAGSCQAGTTVDCADSLVCTVDSCDETNDQCAHDYSSCSCSQGQTQSCTTGLPGICNDGTQTCATDLTWGPCVQNRQSETEVCNGVDDDCDGQVDEDLGTTTCGLGVCEHTVDNCVAGQTQVCDPLQGASDEVCDNGLDDDCDGEVNDGCEYHMACTSSGATGTSVSELTTYGCFLVVGSGTDECATYDDCVHTECVAREPAAEATDLLSYACVVVQSPGESACETDEDCNIVCEEGATEACEYTGPEGTEDVGACVAGTRTCVSNSWSACTGEVTPGSETCNGVDDDCDGSTDEGLDCGGGGGGGRITGYTFGGGPIIEIPAPELLPQPEETPEAIPPAEQPAAEQPAAQPVETPTGAAVAEPPWWLALVAIAGLFLVFLLLKRKKKKKEKK